jgi:16S rRNA (uracil1498-N3)-methyltransferase
VPRLFVDSAFDRGSTLALPDSAARHVQVLRLQPGDTVTLFDGRGREGEARIARIGRTSVEVEVGYAQTIDRELARRVVLAVVMPAGDRMEFVVEKATELGAAAIQPLVAERSVLRLAGERAAKKVAHWRAVATSACEQCGRNRLPDIAEVMALPAWLESLGPGEPDHARWLLSLMPDAQPPEARPMQAVTLLSGPEGGLTDAEEAAARARGFVPTTLGARVLRADTAPLALLAHLALGDPTIR